MPFTDRIVGLINESLKGSSLNKKQFQPGSFNGIASLIGRKNSRGELEQLPGILDADGNYKPVEPNAKFNLVIYHKVMTNAYTTVKSSFGDSYDMKCTTEVMMVVWGDGKKMKLTAENLEPMIIFGIPQKISKQDKQNLGLINCTITPLSSNMDRLQVYRQEYPGVDFLLKPNDAFFLLRYRIETVFGQSCIDMCCE